MGHPSFWSKVDLRLHVRAIQAEVARAVPGRIEARATYHRRRYPQVSSLESTVAPYRAAESQVFRSTIANRRELFLPFLCVKRDKISLSEDSHETIILDYGEAADLAFHQHAGSLRERVSGVVVIGWAVITSLIRRVSSNLRRARSP